MERTLNDLIMKLLKFLFFHVYTPITSFFFPSIFWKIKTKKRCIYLTFDDGPNPVTTPYILDILQSYGVKASFFVIGSHAELYKKELISIQNEGHLLGNHTYTHVNGWAVSTETYCKEVEQSNVTIEKIVNIRPTLFRPPFGRITYQQMKKIEKTHTLVFWSMLTQDYDVSLSVERCLQETLKGIKPGAIFVFHDSKQAYPKLKIILPALIEEAQAKGYDFAVLPASL